MDSDTRDEKHAALLKEIIIALNVEAKGGGMRHPSGIFVGRPVLGRIRGESQPMTKHEFVSQHARLEDCVACRAQRWDGYSGRGPIAKRVDKRNEDAGRREGRLKRRGRFQRGVLI